MSVCVFVVCAKVASGVPPTGSDQHLDVTNRRATATLVRIVFLLTKIIGKKSAKTFVLEIKRMIATTTITQQGVFMIGMCHK